MPNSKELQRTTASDPSLTESKEAMPKPRKPIARKYSTTIRQEERDIRKLNSHKVSND